MSRDTTEGTKRIDMVKLNSKGILGGRSYSKVTWSINGEPNGNIDLEINTIDTASESPYVEFTYKTRSYWEEEWKDMNYRFKLVSIPCNFGGKRWFFVCGLYRNGIYCGRRARILYSVGNWFGCRHCADLSYESCNRSKTYRQFPLRYISKSFEADEYYDKYVKREYYNGRPTRKYKRYLKLLAESRGLDERDLRRLSNENNDYYEL